MKNKSLKAAIRLIDALHKIGKYGFIRIGSVVRSEDCLAIQSITFVETTGAQDREFEIKLLDENRNPYEGMPFLFFPMHDDASEEKFRLSMKEINDYLTSETPTNH